MKKASLGLFAVAMVLVGCAVPVPVIAPNEALLAANAAATDEATPGRAALLVTPAAADAVFDIRVSLIGEGPVLAQLQTGAIATSALKRALDDGLRGGVQQVSAVPARGERFDATLVVDTVRFGFSREFLWVIPVPVPLPPFILPVDKYAYSTSFVMDLRLLDTRGQTAWTRSYADGEGRFELVLGQDLKEAFGRAANEAASRLSHRALDDLRDWLAAERMKPREM